MARHEASCIRNPDRSCFTCAEYELEPLPLTELIKIAARIPFKNTEEDLKELDKAANGCPACMLAAIIQSSKVSESEWDAPEDRRWVKFDYKKAQASLWANEKSVLP